MAKTLTQYIQDQITAKRIKMKNEFKINSVDKTSSLISSSFSASREFGAASATFVLNNNNGQFSDGGSEAISPGDIVEFIEYYDGDATDFKKFYGKVQQRANAKTATSRTMTLTCLDIISELKNLDIQLELTGNKAQVTEEILEPVYLPAPNDTLAQIFNFANNNIASNPPASIVIRPKGAATLVTEQPRFDGFDIKHQQGQLLMGTPLQAQDNYNVVATSYNFYTQGLWVEDIIEEIIKKEDGYGKFLFGESSAANVVANHLTDTFNNVTAKSEDTLTPNLTPTTIKIRTTLTQAYDPDGSGDATTIYVTDTEGFPSSGTGDINGDTFTWSGKTATTLTGVSESGSTALKEHPVGGVVSYETEYEAGRVWYLTYSNISSTLSTGSFTGIDSGISIDYRDNRFGRIILSSGIGLSSNVKYTTDYTFKTLQASGVEINEIKFFKRTTSNRFEAIQQVRQYVQPNYLIRTIGDDKIWSSYLSQRINADYDLNLVQSLNYLEDEDLYTRVVLFGKNIDPTNIMFDDAVSFVTTGEDYKATAVQSELSYEKDEGNYLVYRSAISDAGRIDSSIVKPVVFINGVPVNDTPQQITLIPVRVTVSITTETEVEEHTSGSPDITTRTFYHYKARLAHTSIDPTQPIMFYDSVGNLLTTLEPNNGSMDYGTGVYHVPGSAKNATVEQYSTASYTVFYATSGVNIDHSNVRFKISKQLLPNQTLGTVTATFQYFTAITPLSDAGSVIDGRFDTQVQTVFFAEPPTGLRYAILDLGQIKTIQGIDILSGFYRPDEFRKFALNFRFSLRYSTDNITYSKISDATENVELSDGRAIRFEEEDLGLNFQARYLLVVLTDVKKIEFNNGIWPVAFSQISAFNDVILESEAKIIPTTSLTSDVLISALDSSGVFPTTFNVASTSGFTDPESGETATAYIGTDSFTYTGLTATSFLGVEGLSEDHLSGDRVSQTLEDSNTIYDDDGLLPKLGDRIFKDVRINNDILFTQNQLDTVSKGFLKEFYKNHTRATVNVLYSPHLEIGQTVSITDTYNNLSGVNYFIEGIEDQGRGIYKLTLARYPS